MINTTMILPVSSHNIKEASETAFEIFPNEDLRIVYRECIEANDPNWQYFLLYYRESSMCPPYTVGITGFYVEDNEFWLGWFGIVPGWQRQGLGSFLLRQTIKRVKELGGKRLFLWSDPEAIRAHAFYRRHRFQELSGLKEIDGRKAKVFKLDPI